MLTFSNAPQFALSDPLWLSGCLAHPRTFWPTRTLSDLLWLSSAQKVLARLSTSWTRGHCLSQPACSDDVSANGAICVPKAFIFQSGKKRCYTPNIMYISDIQSDLMQKITHNTKKIKIADSAMQSVLLSLEIIQK